MQIFLNCHLAAFRVSLGHAKKRPNDNLKRFACLFALVSVQSYWPQCDISLCSYQYTWPQLDISFWSYQSTWPQTDINPCSYQPSQVPHDILDSTLLGRAFFDSPRLFCLAYHLFL